MSSSHSSTHSSRERGVEHHEARRAFMPTLLHAALLLALPLALMVAALALPATARAIPHASHSGSPVAVSISPQSGPVGARIIASGSHFKAGTPVDVGYTTGDCSNMTNIPGASGTAGNDGNLSVSVTWPQTSAGSYTVCVRDKNTNKVYPSANPFQVLSASAASLTVSSPVVSATTVTVTGSNFLPGGASVEVFYGQSGSAGAARGDICANSAGTKTTDSKGGFTLTFKAPFYSVNTPLVITAVSPQASCGGSPVLMAQKNVTVLAVAPTKAVVTPSSGNNIGPVVWPPTGIWSVVYCLIGLLLFLLLLLALLVASRSRNQQASASTRNQQGQAGNRLMGQTQVGVGADGRPTANESIYAQGRRGPPVHVANVVDTVEEESMPDLTPSSGTNPPTPRYGPPRP